MSRRRRYGWASGPHPKLEAYTYPPSEYHITRMKQLAERIEQYNNEENRRYAQGKFRAIFDELLRMVVHNTMVSLHKQLRNSGMHGKCLRSFRTCHYKQEHFEIHPSERHGVFFRLSVYGNYHLQCVCICLTFLKREYNRQYYRYLHKQLKVITHCLKLEDLQPELFPKLLNQGIHHARIANKETT